jgi:RimJ/RimL family protein N-acetyltransferase
MNDLPAVARMNRDARVMEFMPSVLVSSISDGMVERWQSTIDSEGFGFWAVEAPGIADFIGFVGLARPDFAAAFMPCVEIGWRLDHAYWGQGYATEAARLAMSFGFDQLGLTEIVSFTVAINERSRRVMQRLGMQHYSAEDFDHPALPVGDRLSRHVLYRMSRDRWRAQAVLDRS